jgi:hypothetical protein
VALAYKLALLLARKGEEPELIWVEAKVDYHPDEEDIHDRRSTKWIFEKLDIPWPSQEHINPEFNLEKYVPCDTQPESRVATWENFSAKNRNLQVFWPFNENESEVGN